MGIMGLGTLEAILTLTIGAVCSFFLFLSTSYNIYRVKQLLLISPANLARGDLDSEAFAGVPQNQIALSETVHPTQGRTVFLFSTPPEAIA